MSVAPGSWFSRGWGLCLFSWRRRRRAASRLLRRVLLSLVIATSIFWHLPSSLPFPLPSTSGGGKHHLMFKLCQAREVSLPARIRAKNRAGTQSWSAYKTITDLVFEARGFAQHGTGGKP